MGDVNINQENSNPSAPGSEQGNPSQQQPAEGTSQGNPGTQTGTLAPGVPPAQPGGPSGGSKQD